MASRAMVRPVALLATLLFLLAGCASGPVDDDGDQASTTATTTVTTVVGERRVPMFTDTLHLLERPTATIEAPDTYTDLRIPLEGLGEGAVSAANGPDAWSFPLPDGLTGITGTATFWVEVQGTVLRNPNPGAGGCFWEFRFLTGDPQTGQSNFAPCVKEDVTVAEGLRAITFVFDLPAASVPAGGDLRFELYVQSVGKSPDARIDLLTGSIVHDSVVQVAGLRLPLDSTLLLSS
jgi:hypothetical protein